jgi:hypothetical protein
MTPPDCDLRGVEFPREIFVEMAMGQFGISRQQAEEMVDAVIAQRKVH